MKDKDIEDVLFKYKRCLYKISYLTYQRLKIEFEYHKGKELKNFTKEDTKEFLSFLARDKESTLIKYIPIKEEDLDKIPYECMTENERNIYNKNKNRSIAETSIRGY